MEDSNIGSQCKWNALSCCSVSGRISFKIIEPAYNERNVPTPPCVSSVNEATLFWPVSANGISVKTSLNDGNIDF